MNLLLDTHVILWALADPGRLGEKVIEKVRNLENNVWVSAVSIWEISIKSALGKLEIPDDFPIQIEKSGFQELSITGQHALLAGRLPPHHPDPFDRMLISQAASEGLTLVTRDPQFRHYGISLLMV